MVFKDKKVLVCGIARTGVAVANLLHKKRSKVTLIDSKSKEELAESIKKINTSEIKILTQMQVDEVLLDYDFVVVSPGIPSDLSFFQLALDNKIEIYSEIEIASVLCICDIIAISGTNGKTTVSELLGKIFRDLGYDAYVLGNNGVPFSDYVLDFKKDSVVILETSSFQMEYTKTLKPKIAAILNISEDHIDRHKTMENYIKEKEKIISKQDEDDFFIYNLDDDILNKIKNTTKSQKYSFSYKNKEADSYYFEKNIYLNSKKVLDTREIKLLGRHNIENIMAALLVCDKYNLDITKVVNSIKEFAGVEHRVEFVKSLGGVDFYNDSKATNVDSTIVAIEAMDKDIILILGGLDKGIRFDNLFKSFNNKVKDIIVLGESKEIIIEDAKKYNFKNYHRVDDLKSAVNLAKEIAHKGDVVLFSPASASWDMFKDFEERGRIFKSYI